jgi:hypothetical protein
MITGPNPRSVALQEIYNSAAKLKNAENWLTERGDSNERREQRSETVEWAILVNAVAHLVTRFT